MPVSQENKPGRNILFLDGECAFCQRSAQFIHRLDKNKNLFFSSLQGKTARMLPEQWRSLRDENSRPSGYAVLVENAHTEKQNQWRGADAILRALWLAGGPTRATWIFYYLPHFIKDHLYQLISHNRHQIVSHKNQCPLPKKKFTEKLLP